MNARARLARRLLLLAAPAVCAAASVTAQASAQANAQATSQAFPDQLLGDALTRRCSPVLDTTNLPGLTAPLWRYGVYEAGRDTLKKASAAYWCDMPTANEQVSLVIWRAWGDGPVPGGCADVIPYRGGPGGLRFERRGTMDLREARLVDEPSKRGPPVTARATVIISEYDGRSVRFVCHTGRWYFTRE
jgi:hypothetical protein